MHRMDKDINKNDPWSHWTLSCAATWNLGWKTLVIPWSVSWAILRTLCVVWKNKLCPQQQWASRGLRDWILESRNALGVSVFPFLGDIAFFSEILLDDSDLSEKHSLLVQSELSVLWGEIYLGNTDSTGFQIMNRASFKYGPFDGCFWS